MRRVSHAAVCARRWRYARRYFIAQRALEVAYAFIVAPWSPFCDDAGAAAPPPSLHADGVARCRRMLSARLRRVYADMRGRQKKMFKARSARCSTIFLLPFLCAHRPELRHARCRAFAHADSGSHAAAYSGVIVLFLMLIFAGEAHMRVAASRYTASVFTAPPRRVPTLLATRVMSPPFQHRYSRIRYVHSSCPVEHVAFDATRFAWRGSFRCFDMMLAACARRAIYLLRRAALLLREFYFSRQTRVFTRRQVYEFFFFFLLARCVFSRCPCPSIPGTPSLIERHVAESI